MKRINLLTPIFIMLFSIFFVKTADAACVTMKVSLSSDGNWPAGESVKISCMGDNPPGPSSCIGDSDSIKPGEQKTLTQCTCPEGGGAAGSGCLVVESKPSQCTQPEVKKYENYCASNGNTIDTPLVSSCTAAPTPTPVCGGSYCQDWGSPPPTCVKDGKTYYKAYKECKVNGTPVDYPEQECGSVPSCEIPAASPTPSTGPQCGADCSADPNVCDNISGCNVCDTNTKTCVPPSGGPVCGADCSADPNVCDNISGCNVCDTNTKTCVPPSGGNPNPSPTPTVPGGSNPGGPGPQCNDDCSSNPGICQRAGGGCTYCNPSTNTCQTPPGTTSAPPPPGTTSAPPPPQATATKAPPTATPTPDFNEAMCKCDSMTASQIIAGQPAVFTATSKVTGTDTSKAEAKQIEFLLSAGNNPASRKIIAGPQRVNTTSSGNATEMKYQAQWKITIPQTVEKNVDYLAKATIKCTRKTTAHAYPYTAMVLGDSDSKSIFSVIANFFRNLFGGNEEIPQDSQNQAEQTQDEFMSIAEKNNLQLGSFAPAKVVENTCSSVKFRFE